jgi:hypothetical protein
VVEFSINIAMKMEILYEITLPRLHPKSLSQVNQGVPGLKGRLTRSENCKYTKIVKKQTIEIQRRQ